MAHQHLTNIPPDPLLDLEPWVGQRQASFRFQLLDGVSGEQKGDITPLRNAVLSHDTTRTIKRQMNLSLGVSDTALIDPLRDRVLPYMIFPNGAEYPLGRYMFTDASREVWTSGKLGTVALNDEMFLVDQQIEAGISGVGESLVSVIEMTVAGLDVDLVVEATTFTSAEAWAIGTSRGSILESLSVTGDYFSPWFGNDGKLHFIRTFNPASRLPDFDWDVGTKVMRDSIVESDDLLTAPNRFIVTSNNPSNPDETVSAVVDVPPTAPHSIANRGFAIVESLDLQLSDNEQAQAVASGIAERFTVFQRVSMTTAPDPRHDSYNIINWQGDHWLELAWSLPLVEGGAMSHVLRKSYAP